MLLGTKAGAITDASMETPVFVGDDQQWMNLRPPKPDEYEMKLVEGKNPIQRLNELYHAIPFDVVDPKPGDKELIYK